MPKKDANLEKPKRPSKPNSIKNTEKPKRPPPAHLKEYNEKKSAIYAEAIKPKEHKRLMGRPSIYTEELVNYIIRRVASSTMGLKELCASDDKMPDQSTINEWRWDYPEFSTRYRLAKQHQTDIMGEDCEEISKELAYISDQQGCSKVDPGFIASRKLIVDTKKWHASKLNPTVFGDRKALEQMQGENEAIKAELMALKAQLADVNKKEY